MNEINFVESEAKNIYDTIIDMLEQYTQEPLYPGDERRIFGEALVAVFVSAYSSMNDAARQKMLRYALGEVLDALGERTGTIRLPPKPSKTIIRFSSSVPVQNNIIIPKGTKTTQDGTFQFVTDYSAVLQAGETSIEIPSTCMKAGSTSNGILPGQIQTLVDMIPFIEKAVNTIETYDGDDGEAYNSEGDESYRERIRLSTGKFSTAGPIGAYEYHALTADPDIESVSVTSPAPGEIVLLPLMKNGVLPTQSVLDKVTAVCNDSKVRPLTDLVSAQAPQTTTFDIEFIYYVTADKETGTISTIEGSNGAIMQYVQWQSSKMGRDINPDQLRRFVLRPDWTENLTGALRLDVAKPEFTEIEEGMVAQFSGNLTVSHKVVYE